MKAWSFELSGGKYILAKEKMTSSKALVQIVFKKFGKKNITIQRSLDGVAWTDANVIESYLGKTFDTTLVNGGSNLYIRAITDAEVDYAKIELDA